MEYFLEGLEGMKEEAEEEAEIEEELEMVPGAGSWIKGVNEEGLNEATRAERRTFLEGESA